MPKKQLHNGFSMIELIIVLGILGVVTAAVWPLLSFSRGAETVVKDEYRIQAEMRIASEKITQYMRHATIGFTVTQTQLNSGPMRDEWSYFVLENHKTRIVNYEWLETSPGVFAHVPRVIVEAQKGVTYNLTFAQSQPGTKLIEFTLEGVLNGNDDTKVSVSSQLTALNSVAIDDSGTAADPAVALAYRNEPAPTPQNLSVAVTMVLDNSGSMQDAMGGTGGDATRIRNDILEQEAKKLVDKFASMGYVHVSIIPYAKTATTYAMLNARDNKDTIKGYITALSGNGGTNTGDGMRRAYYVLHDYNNANPTVHILNYVILLSDGNPTYYNSANGYYDWESHPGGWGWYQVWQPSSYITSSGNVSDGNVRGTGDDTDWNVADCMPYIQRIGSDLFVNGGLEIKTIGIGLTGIPAEVNRMNTIATSYCENPATAAVEGSYYAAENATQLETVFNGIQNQILNEVWHIYGPY